MVVSCELGLLPCRVAFLPFGVGDLEHDGRYNACGLLSSLCVCVAGAGLVVVQVCARLGVFLNVKAVGQLVTSCHQLSYISRLLLCTNNMARTWLGAQTLSPAPSPCDTFWIHDDPLDKPVFYTWAHLGRVLR